MSKLPEYILRIFFAILCVVSIIFTPLVMGFLAWGIFGGYGITSVTFMVIFTIVALIMTVFGIITQISVVRSAWKIAENSIRYLKKT